MQTELLKLKLEELFKNTPENIGVMYSKKIKNGEHTSDNCITFMVEKKISLNELSENEILPSSVDVNGVSYMTDVVEVGRAMVLSCGVETLTQCYQWQTVNPLNQNRIRPLQGGIQINSTSHSVRVGTLGFLATDKLTNILVGVTNNHVIVNDAFYTGNRDLSGIFENEGLTFTDYVFQNGNTGNLSNYIGEVIRYVPLKKTDINYVDGALTSIGDPFYVSTGPYVNPQTPRSWMQYGLTGITAPMPFATTTELDSLITNPPDEVWSNGRTTGPKQGICGLKVNGIGVFTTVGYYNSQGVPIVVNFGDLISFTRINPDCFSPIEGGDSGSALIGVFNGVKKIIGLVFASAFLPGEPPSKGYACRIDKVAENLGIKAWDGINQNFASPFIDYFTVPGGNFDKTLLCSGVTYWQVGLTDATIYCNCPGVKMIFNVINGDTINFSIQGNSNFNMTVDWGDGFTSLFNGNTNYSPSHTYTTTGRYTVQIGVDNCNVIQTLNLIGTPQFRYPLINISGIGNFVSLNSLIIRHTTLNVFNPEVSLPGGLLNLVLNDNELNTFNPTIALPNSLKILDVSFNLLTSFNPTLPLPSRLFQLFLNNNLLTSFNPTQPLPTLLTTISLQNNNLNTNNVNITLDNLSNVTWTSVPPRLLNIRQNPAAPPSVGPPNGIQAKTNLQALGWTVNTD